MPAFCILQPAKAQIGERVRPRQALRFSERLGPENFSLSCRFGWSFPLPMVGVMCRRWAARKRGGLVLPEVG